MLQEASPLQKKKKEIQTADEWKEGVRLKKKYCAILNQLFAIYNYRYNWPNHSGD